MFFIKLENLRDKSGKRQKDVADAIDVARTTYAMYEQGKREPNFETLQKIADYFGVEISYFFDVSENESYKGTIPLVGAICAGDGLLSIQNIEDRIYYPFPNPKIKPDYALRVKGNSMIGVGIENDDIVFLRAGNKPEYNGQIVAAIVNEEGMLKRIKFNNKTFTVQLIPENDDFETKEYSFNEVQVCGVYMGHFKPERNI